ncbi:hypothetical protein [Microvirga arsenatis]|uniref:Transposase n=1 Tax=Microvirga arsenatis TaxID=2692265 RepID=A0ABW9YW89_9HYPH|nr:hypothetical protein [Microvirga arsenatis]NBJ13308.1 hypothetical protein [Microvirga arsenatis]NBJ24092.1 hypothetical protein [Microvirga arsenatis]
MKRVPVTPRYRGPITRYTEKRRIDVIAELSKHCGWGKPIVKLPKDKH